MLHGFGGCMRRVKVPEQSLRLELHPTEGLVKDLVCDEFLFGVMRELTYDMVAVADLEAVQVVQLSLALVELIQVRHLQGDPSVGLVHQHCQVVLDALHRHVLPDRPQLVIDVPVGGLLLAPLVHHQLQCLPQNTLGTHIRRVRLRNESVVGLLQSLAGALDGQVTPVGDRRRALRE